MHAGTSPVEPDQQRKRTSRAALTGRLLPPAPATPRDTNTAPGERLREKLPGNPQVTPVDPTEPTMDEPVPNTAKYCI